ncbi:MAG: hypothetical protein K8U57_18530 [Planctomycetes bacterium]|nr:hypothetical protein [Planctomycetota bacterium]
MPAFTYQWTNQCRLNMLEDEGNPLSISAGNNFSRRNVEPGDFVYVIGTWQGPVYLIGRMRVRRIWQRGEWEAHHAATNLWAGDEIIEGVEGTPMRMEFPIPPSVLRLLRFVGPKGEENELAMTPEGTLDDPQCIRSVRRLTTASAELLDGLLR